MLDVFLWKTICVLKAKSLVVVPHTVYWVAIQQRLACFNYTSTNYKMLLLCDFRLHNILQRSMSLDPNMRAHKILLCCPRCGQMVNTATCTCIHATTRHLQRANASHYIFIYICINMYICMYVYALSRKYELLQLRMLFAKHCRGIPVPSWLIGIQNELRRRLRKSKKVK